jgi:hypothetical protein
MIPQIFNLTEIQKTYNNISRYGKMLVSMQNDNERFLIYKCKNIYYEFEIEKGNCTRCVKSLQPFKYLNVLINSEYNDVKNK